MKLSLKSQSKATVAGLVGFLLPSLLLKNVHVADPTLLIAVAVLIANASGYYQGTLSGEAAVLDSQGEGINCRACDGVAYHFYDCPEAQE